MPYSGILKTNVSQIYEQLRKVKVFIADLPKKFHEDIADMMYQRERQTCIFPKGYGCDRYRRQEEEYTICDTNQFTSERIFHERLNSSNVNIISLVFEHL